MKTPEVLAIIEDIGNKKLLKGVMESNSFIDTLETAAAATLDQREHLYVGKINGVDSLDFSFVGKSEINGDEIIIENKITGKISSLIHNHYLEANINGVNLLPTFSEADISTVFSARS